MMNNKAASVTIIVCIITLTALCFIEAIDITIVNNENETGVDNSSCLVGDIHCSALDFVFSNLSDCHNEPYNVLILGGNYDFNLNSTVTDNLFKNCPAINITGESTDSTSIVCGMDAGFAFQNILQVKIANITFTNCGSLRNSTSVNITVNSPNITLPLSAALYFTYCKNVQIINVIVENSNSTGVVMYNTYGVLLVEGTSFIGNSNQKNSLPSNGGLYIEFVYCEPGRVDENCVQQKNSHAHYCLKSNKFLFNYALNKFQGTLFHTPFKTKYYSFGRGGGLSIVFKGNASNNTVHIDDCEFFGNTASRGGGLLVEFEDFSNNNKMNISNTNFSENRVIVDVQNGYGTAGGGVRVGFVIYEQKSVQFNSMIFENCSFAGNTALSGGGFGMYIPYEPNVINATNSLSFKNCSWTRNKGLLGSAIDLDFWRFQTAGAKMQVTFSTCTFCDNKDSVQNNLDITTVWFDFNSFGAGALYANGIPVIFEESVEFINNTGSALAVYDTTVRFADGCHACFINNSAWVGGAVVMLGASQMWIYPHTKFLFEMNRAKLRGGAIYVLQTSRHDLLSGGNCFLQYSNHSVSSPCDWMTNFTFVNNTAPTGTSIFATTLLSCAWGESLKNLNHSLLNVLNWTNFSYYPSDNNTIATEVSKISVETNRPIEIIPGKYSTLPITTVDDKGNDVSRSLWLVSNNKSVQVSWHITSNSSINLQGTPNSEATIEIVTDISRVISAKLPVKLAECPPGYYLDVNNVNGTCQCSYLNSEQRLDGILSCDSETFTAKIKRGYWAGYHLSAEHPTPTDINLVTGQCPRHYCVVKDPDGYLPGTNNITLLNEMFCSTAHRNGTLCGRCSNGYGVAINSVYFDCVDCSDWLSQHGWIIYALTEYVPLTLLFCIILFFDINLHSGTISSVVLYFQIFDFLDIYSDGDINPLPHSDGIVRGIYFVYNIWNLEFFGFLLPSYCLNKHFNAMDIFVIKYVSGFYPFVLFVLFLALTNLVYVNCCGVAKVARYIRNECTWCRIRINRKGSTVNGLATLWTLVFTKLAVISGLILSQGTLTGSEHSNLKLKVAWLNGNLPYGGEAHLPYMIPAVVILLFFVIIPAVGLFCYPLVPQILGFIERKCAVDFKKCKLYNIVSCALQKPFTDLKPLIDCFQGDCRERCEFYAGLLFLYRIATVIVFSFRIKIDIYFYNTLTSLLLILITAILQPYEKWRDNVVTALCFANILFISVLSLCLLYYTETQSNRNLQPWLLLQLVMVLLPLVFFVVFMMWRSWQKLEACLNKGYSYNRVSQNETDELNFPVRALEDSAQSQANESNDNGRCASPHSSSASGSVQNREGTSEGNNSKSSINPNANYGSCGYQHNTSDN